MKKKAFGVLRTPVVFALLACIQLIVPIQACAYPAAPDGASTNQAAPAPAPPAQPAAPPAAPAAPPVNPINLDLSSTAATLSAARMNSFQSTTITVAGQTQAVAPATMLTPAQAVAVAQMLHSGVQSINIGAAGNAVGGSVTITSRLAQHLASLTVPQGVTAIDLVHNSGPLNLPGNLTNAGVFYACTTNPAVNTAIINALNIFNQAGALLTTVLPAGGLPGLPNLVPDLSLQLNAINNIVNAGVISSSASLALGAGGSITNALPAGAGGPVPIMTAARNVDLAAAAGTIVNHGIISSANGNINVAVDMGNSINIENAGGVFSALAGSINIRDPEFQQKAGISILGGDLLSREVNLYSGTGNILVDVRKLSGTVNAYGHEAHLTASTEMLRLGKILLGGDPSFFNLTGSIEISSPLVFHGQNLALIANQDIVTTGPSLIDTSSDSQDGGDFLAVAGAQFTADGSQGQVLPPGPGSTSELYISGGSSTGGKIDLGSNGGISAFTTESTAGEHSGGDVQMIAYAGTAPDSGTLRLPSSVTIHTGGTGNANNGYVQLIAGSKSGTAICTGDIDTTGSTSGGGIYIYATTPNTDGVTVIDGAIPPGGGGWGYSDLLPACINTGNLSTSGEGIEVKNIAAITTGTLSTAADSGRNGGNIEIEGMGNVATGAITTDGAYAGRVRIYCANQEGTTTVSNITINGAISANSNDPGDGGGGSVDLDTPSGNIIVSGPISATGFGQSSWNAGNVYIEVDNWANSGSPAPASCNIFIDGSINVNAGTDGRGGSVNLSVGTGTIFVNGDISANGHTSASGGGYGSGGEVTLDSHSSQPFVVGGALTNGVAGTVSARALGGDNEQEGTGGSLRVQNTGTGGITLRSWSDIGLDASSQAGYSYGGTLELMAGTDTDELTVGTGPLRIPQGTLNLDGYSNGSNSIQGGRLKLIGAPVTVTGPGGGSATAPFIFSGRAHGLGSGGTCEITSGGPLATGDGSGKMIVSVPGTSADQPGYIRLSAGTNLDVDLAFLNYGGLPGQINFSSGTTGPGDLFIHGGDLATNSSGNIYLSMNSSAPFQVYGATGGNGTTGRILANNTLQITNHGTGGIIINDYNHIGTPQNVTLSAPAGSLSIPQGVLNLYSTTLVGKPLVITRPGGALPATAPLEFNGLDGWGIVSVTTLAGDLTVGDGAAQIKINGPASALTITAGGNLTVDLAYLGTPQQYGALELSAGTTGAGKLLVVGALSWGVVTLSSNSELPFKVAAAAAGENGTTGSITTTNGDLIIRNLGAGGITIAHRNDISWSGSYAGLELSAPHGLLSVPQGEMQGYRMDITGCPLAVTADGGGTPTATLNLHGDNSLSLASTGDLMIDNLPGHVQLYLGGAQWGDFRWLISAGGNLTVDLASLAMPQAPSAPTLSLTAGTSGNGNLLITNGNLIASGTWAQNAGGTITLRSNSADPFIVGGPTSVNGITGRIVAQTNQDVLPWDGAWGGTVSIINNGTGGITIADPSAINASAAAAGSITISAPYGPLNIAQGTLRADSLGAKLSWGDQFFGGGTITLESQSLHVVGPGGSGAATGTLLLEANGSSYISQQYPELSGDTRGGTIRLLVGTGDLSIGNGAGALNFSTWRDNGSVNESAGGNVTVDPTAMSYVSNLTISASGGQLQINGPFTGTSINLSSQSPASGTLLVTGSITAGSICLNSSSKKIFAISPGASGITNGVKGNLLADGTSGGFIMLAARSGFTIGPDAIIQAAGTTGSGGRILFTTFIPGSGTLEANVDGLIQANSDSDTTGTVAFYSGPGHNITLAGTGVVHGGESINLGNLEFNADNPADSTFALINPLAGIITIGGSLDLSNAIRNNGSSPVPPTPPGPSSTGSTVVGLIRGALLTDALLAAGIRNINNGLQFGGRAETDVTRVMSTSLSSGLSAERRGQVMQNCQWRGAGLGSINGNTNTARQTAGHYYNLDQGNIVFAPTSNLVVGTHEGNVYIAGGSIAFIMETGHDVAIYNLHDSTSGGMQVVVNKKMMRVPLGSQLVLTRAEKPDFDKINPGKGIAYRPPRTVEFGDGITGFISDFSLLSAMATVAPLRTMLKDPQTRREACKVLKNAAILASLSIGRSPFSPAK